MRTRRPRRAQQGVATLIVVALLFFVMSMVAAYTNRNLIFEQRTASNQYRSTQAFEAASAGVEWALALLNGGRIDAACAPSATVADDTFRQRYLNIDPATGMVTPRTGAAGLGLWPSCVFDGTDWSCDCPGNAAPAVAAPVGTGVYPAFRLRFVTPATPQPGVIRLEVNGCTRLDNTCLNFPAAATAGESRSTLTVMLSLRSALPAPPAAALTVRDAVDAAGVDIDVFNADARTAGITVLAGGAVSGSGLRAYSAPGTPGAASVLDNDPGLQSLANPADPDDGTRLFTSTFSTWPQAFREQPALAVLDCPAGCDASQVRAAAAARPGHAIWVDGDLALDAGGDVGSAAEPLLLVVTGSVSVDVPFHGLLYSRAETWASAGTAGRIVGAAMAENRFGGTGGFEIVRDSEVLTRLRWTTGSFVRLPGGWRDF
jgi:hypothetical protein